MGNWGEIIIGDSRSMMEVERESIDLIVTSPPYWHIKDYGIPGQIGYGETLHDYLRDLYSTWSECFRVLREGGRLCINIGDQFARSAIYGRYKVIPIHAEFIAQCERIGFDFMGSIIWQKKTTMNTTGGAVVMGSFPYPPNGVVEIDYEFVHILKKPGNAKKVPKDVKESSRLAKEEWKEYFSGHWHFRGAKQIGHEAMFPDELPKRLIRMFTFVGDTVLDPFLGSGTTMKVALELQRNAMGYEINEDFLQTIKSKLGMHGRLAGFYNDIQVVKSTKKARTLARIDYTPWIQDATPQVDPKEFDSKRDKLYKVIDILDEGALKINTGHIVRFLGIRIDKRDETFEYLSKYLLGKDVILRPDPAEMDNKNVISAYVYLKNKIFVNSYLLKSGVGSPDESVNHRLKDRFVNIWNGGGDR